MSIHTPKEAYDIAIETGVKRTKQNSATTFYLSFLGGMFIALGGFLAIRACAAMPYEIWGSLNKLFFGALFPMGLMFIILTGTELFTSDCFYVSGAFYEKKASFIAMVKNWTLSWSINFLGALFIAYFIAYESGFILEKSSGKMPWAAYIVNMANMKVSLTFYEVFLRGILANWLVCMAAYLAYTARSVPGKVIALWIPVAAFVTMGGEHSIANMFFIPLGLFAGNDPSYITLTQTVSASHPVLIATWQNFAINNLLPATIGNIVGGAIFVGFFYYLIYGNKK